MLSEQLVSKTASPGELDLGVTNDIVCFSFQHAPKGRYRIAKVVDFLLIDFRCTRAGGHLMADTKSAVPFRLT